MPETSTGASAAQQTIAVIGDAWTVRIVRTVFRGRRRYGDFVSALGISRAVLTDRLDKLVRHEVLLRAAPDGRHPEYRLTERGLDLWTLYVAMWLWESDWGSARDPHSPAADRPRETLFHTACQHAMRPQMRCAHCQQEVLAFDTRPDAAPDPAPGAGPVSSSLPAARGPARQATASAFRRVRQSPAPASEDAATAAATEEADGALVRVIGDRWNSAIVAAAFRGLRTFSQFQGALGIGSAQLSGRLAELQRLGILRARAYAGARQEYRLTRAGIALFPMTLELLRWGNRWLIPDAGRLHVRHLPCAQALVARWHCGHCQAELQRESLQFR